MSIFRSIVTCKIKLWATNFQIRKYFGRNMSCAVTHREQPKNNAHNIIILYLFGLPKFAYSFFFDASEKFLKKKKISRDMSCAATHRFFPLMFVLAPQNENPLCKLHYRAWFFVLGENRLFRTNQPFKSLLARGRADQFARKINSKNKFICPRIVFCNVSAQRVPPRD